MRASVSKKRAMAAFQPLIAAEVVRQHAELAAFLWGQRDTLASEDAADIKVIEGIDHRLHVNLDGMRIAGKAVWPFLLEQYESFPEKGELFAFAWMALESKDPGRITQSIEFGQASKDGALGLIGALAWQRPEAIGPLVREWISEQNAFKRYLAVSACAEHGVDPKQLLGRLVRDTDAGVRASSLRLAGKLRRADLVHEALNGLDADDEKVRLWAAWALTEFGSGDMARAELRRLASAGGPEALIALRAAIKAGPDKEVRVWMGGMMKSLKTAPLAVRGIGMLSDRSVLAWLIQQMRVPMLATSAAAAFLELFPEAHREDDLFTRDHGVAGQIFAEYFGDESAKIPLADKIEAWATSSGRLSKS